MRNSHIEDAWSKDDLGPEPTVHETKTASNDSYIVRLVSIALLYESVEEKDTEFQIEVQTGEGNYRHTEVLPMNISTTEGGLLYFDIMLTLLEKYTIKQAEDWLKHEYPMVFDWTKINQTNKAA